MGMIGNPEKIFTVEPAQTPLPQKVDAPSVEPATVPANPDLVPA